MCCTIIIFYGGCVRRQTRQLPADMRPLVACIASKTNDDYALKPLQAMLDSWALVADRKGIHLRGHACGSIQKSHAQLIMQHAPHQ